VLTIQCLGPYKWRTRTDFEIMTPIKGQTVRAKYYRLDKDGRLWIRSGYAWNGTSGGVRDSDKNLGASLVHDAFYQMFREDQLPLKLRGATDKLFGQHCRELGTTKGRARLYVWGLRVFGKRYATRDQFKVAPTMRIPMPRGTEIALTP